MGISKNQKLEPKEWLDTVLDHLDQLYMLTRPPLAPMDCEFLLLAGETAEFPSLHVPAETLTELSRELGIHVEHRIGVPALWRADFALTCHGNSMAAMIQDGDIVCIRKQPEVENGEIAAVRIGEEATLKRFYRQGDTVMLQAENPAFSPLVYTRDQLNEITIEGRVVGICRGI